MNQYVKEGHIINATEKAYEKLYKEKGYVVLEEKKVTKSISKMNKEELLAYAVEKNIEMPIEITKVDDIKLFLKEIEEKKEEADS